MLVQFGVGSSFGRICEFQSQSINKFTDVLLMSVQSEVTQLLHLISSGSWTGSV